MAKPPINLLAVKSDGTIKLFENVQRPINMGTLLSEGAYTLYPVGDAHGQILNITNGIFDFPWQFFSKPTVSIPATLTVPADTTEFWLPVTVSSTRDQSCHVVATVGNAAGGGINTGDANNRLLFTPRCTWHFCRGDDPIHWVRYVRPSGTFLNGQSMLAQVQTYGSTNGDGTTLTCTVSFATGVPAQVITTPYHRQLRRLNLGGATRSYDLNPSTIQHHDTGYIGGVQANGACWRSRLAHGYSQFGNGETGIYLNEDVPAFSSVVQDPITTGSDAFGDYVRLHTYQFASDFTYGGSTFKQQAVMIQGQRINEACGTEGVWTMRAVTPGRTYSWPAFWLIGRTSSGADAWPPEIDIMEQFNKSWGADYPMTGKYTTAGQHWGDWQSNVRLGSSSPGTRVDLLPGMVNVSSIWDEPHDYACAVSLENNEVTLFFDGIEIACQRLCARREDWSTNNQFFPMMNVAVRSPSSYAASAYNSDASGDMRIYDFGYYPSGHSFSTVTDPWV